MIPMMLQKILHGIVYASAGVATLAAFSGDQLLTWSAAAVALSSGFLTAGIAGYHKLREAARQENIADRAADLESIRAMARIQIELEQRIVNIEKTAGELVKTLETRKTEFGKMFDEMRTNLAAMHRDLESAKCKFPGVESGKACHD